MLTLKARARDDDKEQSRNVRSCLGYGVIAKRAVVIVVPQSGTSRNDRIPKTAP
jgi:hypothetical protein